MRLKGALARLRGGLVEAPGSGDERQDCRGYSMRGDGRRGHLQGFRSQGRLRRGRGFVAREPLRAGRQARRDGQDAARRVPEAAQARLGPALPLDLRGAAAVRGRGVRAPGHGARGLEGGRCSGGRRGHASRGVPLRAGERGGARREGGGARVAAVRLCPRGRGEAEGARAQAVRYGRDREQTNNAIWIAFTKLRLLNNKKKGIVQLLCNLLL